MLINVAADRELEVSHGITGHAAAGLPGCFASVAGVRRRTVAGRRAVRLHTNTVVFARIWCTWIFHGARVARRDWERHQSLASCAGVASVAHAARSGSQDQTVSVPARISSARCIMIGGLLTTVWTESITDHASWTTTDHVGARESRILHARGKWMTAAVVDGATTNVDAGDTVAAVSLWTGTAHSRTLLAIMSF